MASRARRSAFAVGVLGALIFAGCSSGTSPKTSTATTASPESVTIPASAVRPGVQAVLTAASNAATQTGHDSAAAKKYADEMGDDWEHVEGTVKKHDTRLYLQFEDALGAIRLAAQRGDVDAVTKALGTLSTVADQYLRTYP